MWEDFLSWVNAGPQILGGGAPFAKPEGSPISPSQLNFMNPFGVDHPNAGGFGDVGDAWNRLFETGDYSKTKEFGTDYNQKKYNETTQELGDFIGKALSLITMGSSGLLGGSGSAAGGATTGATGTLEAGAGGLGVAEGTTGMGSVGLNMGETGYLNAAGTGGAMSGFMDFLGSDTGQYVMMSIGQDIMSPQQSPNLPTNYDIPKVNVEKYENKSKTPSQYANAFDNGGLIKEPVAGIGLGQLTPEKQKIVIDKIKQLADSAGTETYSIAENGPEQISNPALGQIVVDLNEQVFPNMLPRGESFAANPFGTDHPAALGTDSWVIDPQMNIPISSNSNATLGAAIVPAQKSPKLGGKEALAISEAAANAEAVKLNTPKEQIVKTVIDPQTNTQTQTVTTKQTKPIQASSKKINPPAVTTTQKGITGDDVINVAGRVLGSLADIYLAGSGVPMKSPITTMYDYFDSIAAAKQQKIDQRNEDIRKAALKGPESFQIGKDTYGIKQVVPDSSSPTGYRINVAELGGSLGLSEEDKKQKAAEAGLMANVINVESELNHLLKLNKNSYGGLAGKAKMGILSATDSGGGDQTYINTRTILTSLKSNVVENLKKTFGGQISEGERQFLIDQYGAAEGGSRVEREVAIENIRKFARRKLLESVNADRIAKGIEPIDPSYISEGTYVKANSTTGFKGQNLKKTGNQLPGLEVQ